ncbi:CvpA family protein [Lentilactobacillus kefiri]|uniref:Colicin V production protein n=2 Tax=Lentilactobacillus kefiri TaxID=33962 RepID=A0A8E1RJL8_LENKE|nr:CvpA family protein [Lentilactobacillus kefiri]KRL56804.1 colicin V production protein [Lentilactobacillus parakefiri DSM 10551]KRM50696.1 colicin V production protein [Lentilactobacillus kefiri DSM 20587 = JCM 5818]MCJ2160807.1 CvpA family protein [Lentilactobacillus kefiri]MCP9368062.1 CvpA family protein [Lentilactobacillus kefiri]MDH5107388.1 CvpA family protein [Lentilactobacillus kefiri]
MVFSIGIILILIFGFLHGLSKGFVAEVLSLIGFVLATFVSIIGTSPIADVINNAIFQGSDNETAQVIVKWVIFVLLFGIVWRIVRGLSNLLSPLTRLPIIHQLNSLLGGAADFIIKYLFIFIVLNFLLILPSQSIQDQYQQSPVSQWIVKKTPILSDKMIQIWNQHSSEVNV